MEMPGRTLFSQRITRATAQPRRTIRSSGRRRCLMRRSETETHGSSTKALIHFERSSANPKMQRRMGSPCRSRRRRGNVEESRQRGKETQCHLWRSRIRRASEAATPLRQLMRLLSPPVLVARDGGGEESQRRRQRLIQSRRHRSVRGAFTLAPVYPREQVRPCARARVRAP